MKKLPIIAAALFTVLTLLTILPSAALAAFVSGSTGADGALAPSSNYVVPALGHDDGVYNFTTVTIPSGVTVTFQKNANNSPITVLATGDVTISGTINVNGASATNSLPGSGGPGGFDGGIGGYVNTLGFRGQGPGGGGGGLTLWLGGSGGGGGFGAAGGAGNLCAIRHDGATGQNCVSPGNGGGGDSYGNAGLIPLIGGSGGGGGAGVSTVISGPGGGGGGAILIASSGTIRIDGAIAANGGSGNYAGYFSANNCYNYNGGGGGSGGAIRLVANVITGEGPVTATGGSSLYYNSYPGVWVMTYTGGTGGAGRIRLEAWQMTRVANTNPTYTVPSQYPALLYPTKIPSLAITQVNGINTPAVTLGAFRAPDVILPFNTPSPVTVTVTAHNIPSPSGKTVTVRARPESGSNIISATGTLSGDDSSSSVQVQLAVSSGTSYVLSASVNY